MLKEKNIKNVFDKKYNETRKLSVEEKSKIQHIEDYLDVDFTKADFTIDCIYAICKKLEKAV